VFVMLVVGVAGNVWAFVDDVHTTTGVGQFDGDHASGKSGANNQYRGRFRIQFGQALRPRRRNVAKGEER